MLLSNDVLQTLTMSREVPWPQNKYVDIYLSGIMSMFSFYSSLVCLYLSLPCSWIPWFLYENHNHMLEYLYCSISAIIWNCLCYENRQSNFTLTRVKHKVYTFTYKCVNKSIFYIYIYNEAGPCEQIASLLSHWFIAHNLNKHFFVVVNFVVVFITFVVIKKKKKKNFFLNLLKTKAKNLNVNDKRRH